MSAPEPTLPLDAGKCARRRCRRALSLMSAIRLRPWWAASHPQAVEAKIDQMLAKGANLSDEEIDVAAEYLARNFGPRSE